MSASVAESAPFGQIVIHWHRGLRELLAAVAAEVRAAVAVALADRAVRARVPLGRALFQGRGAHSGCSFLILSYSFVFMDVFPYPQRSLLGSLLTSYLFIIVVAQAAGL